MVLLTSFGFWVSSRYSRFDRMGDLRISRLDPGFFQEVFLTALPSTRLTIFYHVLPFLASVIPRFISSEFHRTLPVYLDSWPRICDRWLLETGSFLHSNSHLPFPCIISGIKEQLSSICLHSHVSDFSGKINHEQWNLSITRWSSRRRLFRGRTFLWAFWEIECLYPHWTQKIDGASVTDVRV
jgi:hypothetical protein